jgi:phytoene dehydrogenase-like protein
MIARAPNEQSQKNRSEPVTAAPASAVQGRAMPERFDIVVAGAGHNSLLAAAYLAKAGYRCVVLEGRPLIGGGVKSAEITLRGFIHDTCSSAHNGILGNPVLRNDELPLGEYGLEYLYPDPVFHMPFSDGSYLTQWRDLDRTCAEFAKFSKKDGEAYRRMITEYETIKPILGAITFSPVGFGKPLNERLAEHPHGKVWQRRLAMSAWDVLHENFEDDHSLTFMMGCPYSLRPLQDPMTGRIAYLPFHQQRQSRPLPKGGSGALTQAMGRYIEGHQGVILPNRWVRRLIIENGRCVGVECEDGSSYRAEKAVLSTIHIKQLVDMAPREMWGQDFLDGVATWEAGPTLFACNMATTEAPKYAVEGGALSPVHSGIMASPERALRLSYDYARGTVNVENPPIHVICCSVADPTRAPAGMHTIKIVAYQPYNLKEGPQHWDQIKEHVADVNLEYLRKFSPNLTPEKILARITESPLDLERMNPHNWHGSCHGGAQDPAQTGPLRPMPGWAQHRMPIAGLYQTGATTHPGGSVTGGPGRNAAMVMLKDFGTSLEEVVNKKS